MVAVYPSILHEPAAGPAPSAFASRLGSPLDSPRKDRSQTITRDVAIIGGGVVGTYAAVRLRDQGKSVVVIEKDDHMGGHVSTYTDPKTGSAVDYGVQAFWDLPGAKAFFARLGVATEHMSFRQLYVDLKMHYIDLSTGEAVPKAARGQVAQLLALGRYARHCNKYMRYVYPTLANLPTPLPAELAELALPFGDFIRKHGLQAALPLAFVFINAVGDVLATPTAYAMAQFNTVHLRGLFGRGVFRAAGRNNSTLFAAAERVLGADVLLRSTVRAATRREDGVVLSVAAPGGATRTVRARKLLVTIPPLRSILAPFDLDAAEAAVFDRWQWQASYVAVVAGSGLPDSLIVHNASPDAARLRLPAPAAFLDSYYYTGVPGLYRTNVVGPRGMGEDAARKLVLEGVARIAEAGSLPVRGPPRGEEGAAPVVAAIHSHTPLQLRFGTEDMLDGAYRRAFALNGRRSTYYAGAAWASDYATTHWEYFDSVILPMIMTGL